MRTINYFLLLTLFSLGGYSQIINFPDAAFKSKLLIANTSNGIALNSFGNSIKIDSNNNGEIEISEALSIVTLKINVSSFVSNPGNIVTLDGIQNFTNLKVLDCSGNQITSLDLTSLALLEEIKCNNNLLNTFIITGLVNLKKINCNHNYLTSFSTNGLVNLIELFIYDNQISSLTFTNNPNLIYLNCRINTLTTLDVSSLSSLEWVSCDENQINNLNVTGLTQIEEIVCANNLLTNLNVDGLSTLKFLSFSGNQISNINLSSLSSILNIECSNNPLSSINVNGLSTLTYLRMNSTLVSSIDCSQSGVTQLFCSDSPNLTSINVKNNLFSYSDPDLLFFGFGFDNLPLLTSICLDSGEENNLYYTNYNSSGNVILYTGLNCSTVVILPPMGINNFEFNNYFSLYPNPVKNIINIDVKESISVLSINIYNNLGQLVLSAPNQNSGKTIAIDVAQLPAGYYFINIISDKGKTTTKFIRN